MFFYVYLFYFLSTVFQLLSAELIIKNEVITCSNNNPSYTIDPDNFVYFESPNYPTSISTGKTNGTINCNANFKRSDDSGNLYFFFMNGNTKFLMFDQVHYYFDSTSNYTSYNYSSNSGLFGVFVTNDTSSTKFYYLPKSDAADWSAFQAAVYAPSSELSSLCFFNNESFNLTSKTQIIPIFAIGESTINETCYWKFTIPDDYFLKINVGYFFNTNNTFTVDPMHSDNFDIDKAGVHYVKGPKIQFFYNKYVSAYLSSGISATVSIVKKTTPTVIKDCLSTFDPVKGYDNNETCSSSLSVMKGKPEKLELSKSYIEKNADKIMITDSDGHTEELLATLYLEPTTSEVYNLNFTSDNNIIQAGFELKQTPIDCSCANKTQIIPCDTIKFYPIMSTEGGYCSNMECDYEFLFDDKCSNNEVTFSISASLRFNTADTFVFYANGQIMTIIDNTRDNQYTKKFYRGQRLTAKFISGNPSTQVYIEPSITILTVIVDTVKFQNIYLTEDEPVYALNLQPSYIGFYNITVQKGYTLEAFFVLDRAFSNAYANYWLYDNFQLIKRLSSTFMDSPFPYRYKSMSGNLQIQSQTILGVYGTVFFRIREIHNKNCETFNNVLQLKMDKTVPTNILVSGAGGPCLYTVVSYFDKNTTEYAKISLNNLFTTASNVTVISGIDPKYPLFRFDKTDAEVWNDVTLQGPYNSFIAHDVGIANISLMYTTDTFKQEFSSKTKMIKGIAYPPNYNYANNQTLVSPYFVGRVTVPKHHNSITFVCKYIDPLDKSNVFIQDQKITNVGQNITFNDNFVDIKYTYTPNSRGFLLEFTSNYVNSSSMILFNSSFILSLIVYYILL